MMQTNANCKLNRIALTIVNIVYLVFSNIFRFSCKVKPGLEWNTSIVPASQQNKKYSRDAGLNKDIVVKLLLLDIIKQTPTQFLLSYFSLT